MSNVFRWKKFLVLLVAVVTMAQVVASAFTDISTNYWADDFVNYLSGRNIITGYPDNTFRPEQPVTRAEFATMLAKSQGLSTTPVFRSAFVDIPGNHWASGAVEAVAQRGWIAGYPGNFFRPNQPISMAEMYTIVSKVSGPQVSASEANEVLAEFSDGTSVPAWARIAVATAADSGIYVKEISPNMLRPNFSASRAEVATTLAKLLNTAFRSEDIATGERVDLNGTLQATATAGEWAVVANGKQYILASPGSLTSQSWFRVGSPVRLTGRIDAAASTNTRTVVRIDNLVAAQPIENQITVTGTLQPSTATAGAWLVVDSSGKRYRILNSDSFKNNSWFGYGSTVELTGNTRTDVTVPSADGTAVVVSDMRVSVLPQQTTLVGTLRQTVTPGGWYIETVENGVTKKYVLLDAESYRNQDWFVAGTDVEVKGQIRTDIPSIYMEGPVLKVASITVDPSDVAGLQQVKLYYPNPLNILRNPMLQLGEPVVRNIQGPDIPEKAVTAILQGPTAPEALRGYFIDPSLQKLTIESVNVSNGTADVVLKAPAVDFKFDNTITPSRLDAQVTQTLLQFSGVRDVDIMVKDPNNRTIWEDNN